MASDPQIYVCSYFALMIIQQLTIGKECRLSEQTANYTTKRSQNGEYSETMVNHIGIISEERSSVSAVSCLETLCCSLTQPAHLSKSPNLNNIKERGKSVTPKKMHKLGGRISHVSPATVISMDTVLNSIQSANHTADKLGTFGELKRK